MTSTPSLAIVLERFFTQRLMQQRQASPHTISSYRDTFRLGCRTFLSCISKGFGGFCSRLLRLRTGKLSSAFRLHGFADIF